MTSAAGYWVCILRWSRRSSDRSRMLHSLLHTSLASPGDKQAVLHDRYSMCSPNIVGRHHGERKVRFTLAFWYFEMHVNSAYIHRYMHACIHIFINTYIHACMHTYIHAYIHAFIHSFIHKYIHIYIHMHSNICSY